MSDRLLKKLNYLAGLAGIMALFGLVIFAANIEIKDLDIWLHLAAGKFIVETHAVPKVDIFSSTIAGHPWINHEWLFQLIVYTVFRWAGTDGLVTLQVVVVTLTFIFLLFFGYRKEKQLIPVFLLALVLLVYQTRFTLRPDIFSFLFFTLYIYIFSRHAEKKWMPWVIFFFQVLWTNMHGFFVLGPLLILIGLSTEGIKRHVPLPFEWNKAGRLENEEYHQLKKTLFLVIAACFLNPYTFQGALYPSGVLLSLTGKSKIFFQYITELQKPFHWSTLFSWGEYLQYKFFIVLTFFGFLFNYRRIDLSAFLFWIVFLILSLMAIRNMVFFALTAYFVFFVNAQYFSLKRFLSRFSLNWFNRPRVVYGFTFLLKIIFIAAMLNYLGQLSLRGYFDFDRWERKSEYTGVSLRNFPYKAVDFLVKNEIKGNFLNDFNSGAYLIGRAFPQIKVFIDGRTEVYGASFFEKYRKILEGDKVLFDEEVGKYKLTGVFLNSLFAPIPVKILKSLYQDKNWVLVYFDYDAVIFLKNIPANKNWIAQYALDLSSWTAPKTDLLKIGTGYVTPYQNLNRAQTLVALDFMDGALGEINEALKILPAYSEAYKMKGKILLKKEEFAASFENLRKAKLLDSSDVETRFLLGKCFYALGEFDQALKQAEYVQGRQPSRAEALFFLALIYIQKKDYTQAFQFLDKAYPLAKERVMDLMKIADLLIEQKEIDRAKTVLAMIKNEYLDEQEEMILWQNLQKKMKNE